MRRGLATQTLVWPMVARGAAAVFAAGATVVTKAARTGGVKDPPVSAYHQTGPAAVRVVKPELRNMTATVGNPGSIEAYEQTAMFAKVSGFIKKFHVDIGDEVKKGQELCRIVVPELEQEHQQKQAQVRLDKKMLEQARQLVNVAQTKIDLAAAEKTEAEADVGKYQAEVVHWESELRRMAQMEKEGVVHKQGLAETRKVFESHKSARDASQAAVKAKEAARLSAEADREKAKIDVETAKAKIEVSEAEERRLAALLDYTRITAPYDGVVTGRNANTGDYVESVSGEKMASGHVPIFVVARTDLGGSSLTCPRNLPATCSPGRKRPFASRP